MLPVLPLSSRHRGLLCHAAIPFLVAPPVLPLSSRRRQFCMCCCAAAAFLVAPLLLSSSRCRSLHRRAAALYIYIYILTPPTSIAPKPIQSHSPYVPVRYRILLSLLLSPAKDLLSRHTCLPHSAADFILKLPFSILSHHLSLHRCTAGSIFLRALTLLSLLRCFRHCAAA